ncbi:hypothetical protein OC861_001577 [Tilletia horrida]|nr:hypothetical protein OC861_001577 [Tilletia horrida]
MSCQTLPALSHNPALKPKQTPTTSIPELPHASSTTALAPAKLSRRGQAHAAKITPFWNIFDCMLQDGFCSRRNPGGVVNMGIANNSLMESELLQFANTHPKLEAVDLTYGTSLFGSVRLFSALSDHFNTWFSPVEPVCAQHIITGPGCGSLLDQLSTHLLDEGDAFLAAAPMYNGFSADAEPRAGVRVLPVYSPYGRREGIEAEWYRGEGALAGFEDALAAEGTPDGSSRVKAVLLCQPHNPSGRIYDRDAVIAYGKFCQKHDLHLVSDEIYALSVFPTSDDPEPQPFVSALSIDWEAEGVHPSRISVIYSASKDTGMNGIRVGCLVTQHNPGLLSAMKMTAKLAMVGSPSDALFSALLSDKAFFPSFVATNRQRLTAAYETIKSWAQHHKLKYHPSNAGHFIMLDLSDHVPRVDPEGQPVNNANDADTLLWAKALEHKISITPGSNYMYPTAGVFRVTFSLLPDALHEGLRRLETVLGLQSNRWIAPSTKLVPFGLHGESGTPQVVTSSATDAAYERRDDGVADIASVEEALLGRRPRQRRHTDSAADLAAVRLPELSMKELNELRKAVTSCCC